MTGTRRHDARSTVRLLAIAVAAVLALAALPLGVASAQTNDDTPEINGETLFSAPEPGEGDDDGLIASLRFAGQQRFATAALVAVETRDQSDRAILARHDEWPDALAGGYLAGVFDAPVLLVSQQNIQDDTLAALAELGVSEITILGGTQAISAESETRLEDEFDYEVDRIQGPTRFETAAMIATEGGAVGEIDGERTAFVATGINFADALTAGPLAYDGNFPIFLTPSQGLHPATEAALADLEIDRVLLLGGTNAVSADVEEEIRDAIGGDADSVTRLEGTTRIETAAEVAGFAITDLGFTPFEHGWARGNDFADALTIGPRLGELGGPLLLVPTPNVVDSGEGTNAGLAEVVRCSTGMIDIAGGFAAVSAVVEDTLRSLLACPDEPVFLDLFADPESAEAVTGEIEVIALVATNTDVPVEGGDVVFDVAEATPDTALVEFSTDGGGVWESGPVTVTTDADGEAPVLVRSDVPASVQIEATHERADEVVLTDVVEISFVPADTGWTYEDLALDSGNEEGDNTAVDEDPPFTGEADIHVDGTSGLVCWSLVVDEPTGEDQELGSFEAFGMVNAHIHAGAAGVAGPVVVPLGMVDDEDRDAIGCGVADTDVLDDIVAMPADYYVNIHTDLFPGGVARAQLELVP